MNRKRIEVFRDFTLGLATLSKCTDRKVACIITDKEGTQVYSIGINGGPKGGRDCLCTLGGKYTCVHAEANAVAKCTVADPNKVVLCTFSPCVTCAAMLLNVGLSEFYYVDSYKDDTGLSMLRDAGVRVRCVSKKALFDEDVRDAAARLVEGEPIIFTRSEQNVELIEALNKYREEHYSNMQSTATLHVSADAIEMRWSNIG